MTRLGLVLLVSSLALLPAAAGAQFGHPLDGFWSGQWGSKEKPNRLLLELDWDGRNITGTINPGSNAATVKRVTIDYSRPASWGVTLEAEGKDATGRIVPIRAEGRLENLGAYRRIFRGTWTQGADRGDFVVTRN